MRHPTVSESPTHPGHMRTWIETKAVLPSELPEPDSFQPSVIKAGLGCCHICRCYLYKTAADKERHMKLFHRPFRQIEPIAAGLTEANKRKQQKTSYHKESLPDVRKRGRPAKDVTETTKEHKCSICFECFGSKHQLLNHRKTEGHDLAARAQAAILMANKRIAATTAADEAGAAAEAEAAAAVVPQAEHLQCSEPEDEEDELESEGEESSEEEESGDELGATVVGMRLGQSTVERFMFWEGSPKDQCTYESNQNTADHDDLVASTVEVFEGTGVVKEAHVKEHVGGSTYKLQLQGASARGIDRSKRQFQMDLADWVSTHPNVVGWKLTGYTEWDKE